MSYSNSFTTLVFATVFAASWPVAATADIACTGFATAFAFDSLQQGYSGKLAKKINPGTSTVRSGSSFRSESCFDTDTGETVSSGSKRTSSVRYTDGPGNSPFQKRNPISSTCEATGTLSCP